MKVVNYTDFMTFPHFRFPSVRPKARSAFKGRRSLLPADSGGDAESRPSVRPAAEKATQRKFMILHRNAATGHLELQDVVNSPQALGLSVNPMVDAERVRFGRALIPKRSLRKGVAKAEAPNVVSFGPVEVDDELLQRLVEQEVAKAMESMVARQGHALAKAKERGASYARNEWGKADNLPLAAAADYSGRSDRVINEDRNAGKYYALVLEGNSRGFRYPSWQFDADLTRLHAVFGLLNSVESMNCWLIHSFLTTPNTNLAGRSPKEVILDRTQPLGPVLALTRARFCCDQGAG